jgi:flagellar basal-body rod modification protein FlgD
MTVSTVNSAGSATILPKDAKAGFAALGAGDFLKLMTAQLQQQDPFSPMDNKEMLAQMAQFSSLSGVTEMGDTLKQIASKLDAVLARPNTTETTPTTA